MTLLLVTMNVIPLLLVCCCSLGLDAARVARSAEVTVGSFTETGEDQVAMVTSHGAVTGKHIEKQVDKTIQEYSAHDLAIIQEEMRQMDSDPDTEEVTTEEERRDGNRTKRFLDDDDRRRWPKAIVPFEFAPIVSNPEEVLAAQTRWHKYTCVRFVPWVPDQTMAKYGLHDEGHVKFNKGNSCSSVQGNYHIKKGQWNSCCSRSTCTHEIGHTMGLWHEHQNPLRHDFTRVEWSSVREHMVWTFRKAHPATLLVWQYDVASRMHYPGPFHILYEDLRPVLRMSTKFYMYKDVSRSHDCKGLYCSDFTQECHNDGFVTLVDDQCACLCPPGLDPATGCATTVTQVTTSRVWPAGAYSMLAPKEGCPGTGVFASGTWQHFGKGNNKFSTELNLAGTFTKESFLYEFCVKPTGSENADAPAWETGRYCILRANDQCPDGFETGSIQFDDSADQPGSGSGQLPGGDFSADTRLEFCCRDDGFTDTPLSNLPSTQPLVLFPHYKRSCQEVSGMRWTLEFIAFDAYPDLTGTEGRYPSGPSESSARLFYCYYIPVEFDCGGEITLSGSNREAVITSPNFPNPYGTNIECTWLIKTESKDDRVLLNFNDFEVTALDGQNCQDSLELRYNIPGQPGVRYCGDGIGRTIRSLNNVVVMTLRSDQHQVDADYGFRVTVSLHSPAQDDCYELATKGTLYRGRKDYTRGMKPCLPWALVTHCMHHAFKVSEFAKGLEENYCRNPDDTAQPWCYTEAEGCKRDYCDVCNIERVYDRTSLCNTETVCSLSRDQIIAAGCAATCGLDPPPAPIRAQTCSQPPSFPDAAAASPVADSYHVGDTVTYTCLTGEETATSTCLSEGHWSPIGYVCGACSPGWATNRGSCYRLFGEDMVTYSTARQTCIDHGAALTSIRDQEEQDFVSGLRDVQYDAWIGATDVVEEGTFLWQDGSPVDWQNWKGGKASNHKNADCAVMERRHKGSYWVAAQCDTATKPLFVCVHALSERTSCKDRLDCQPLLDTTPDLCSQHASFAQQICPFSCGVCDSDSTPRCRTTPPSQNVDLVSPTGDNSVPRGATVTFACGQGRVLTKGQLTLACGDDGKMIGQLPVCEDPETLIQDSNDVAVAENPSAINTRFAQVGVGSKLTIQRTGVIKTWKYFSSQAGWTMFQVWRPDPEGGEYSFRLVGQSQVTTQGQGYEIYDVPEWDWIHVQPGDRLALWEGASPLSRGRVPFRSCETNESVAEFGVVQPTSSNWKSVYSTSVPTSFSSKIRCMVISFKAVLYPVDSVPADIDVATNHISMVQRGTPNSPNRVYLGEGDNFRVPTDGYLSQWHLYVTSPGRAALQVWRPRPDLGVDSFEFIGQNTVTISESEERLHTITVPEGERIAVRAGDITGIWFSSERLGVNADFYPSDKYPEGDRMRMASGVAGDDLSPYDILTIPVKTYKPCMVLSFRAIISQDPNRPRCPTGPTSSAVELAQPTGESTVHWGASVLYRCRAGYDLTEGQLSMTCGQDGNLIGSPPVCQDADALVQDSNNVELTARPSLTNNFCAFVGTGTALTIRRHGVVKQWKFYSGQSGWSVFQVWRPQPDDDLSYLLVGQTQVMTQGQGQETYDIPEWDWIHVQPGDRLGLWEGNTPPGRGKVGFSGCSAGEEQDYGMKKSSRNIRADFSTQVASKFSARTFCGKLSYKAVIYPSDNISAVTALATSHVMLVKRLYAGSRKTLYFGDSDNYDITRDGEITRWQFYCRSPGQGALQVWRPRPDLGTDSFQFVGQTMLDVTTPGEDYHDLTLPQGERIAVKAGDVIGLWYADTRVHIRYDHCSTDTYPEGGQMRKVGPLVAEDLSAGDVVSVPRDTSKTCYKISLRAIVSVK